MSDFQSMPAPQEGYGAPSRGEKPASVKTAINIIWAYIALSVISTLLSFLYLDQIIDDAMAAQPASSAATEEVVRSSVIVGSVVVLVVIVGLSVLLAIFLGKGKNWARIVLTVLVAISLLGGLVGLAGVGGQPIALQVLQVLTLLLAAALVFFLWKKDSSRWLTGKG